MIVCSLILVAVSGTRLEPGNSTEWTVARKVGKWRQVTTRASETSCIQRGSY